MQVKSQKTVCHLRGELKNRFTIPERVKLPKESMRVCLWEKKDSLPLREKRKEKKEISKKPKIKTRSWVDPYNKTI